MNCDGQLSFSWSGESENTNMYKRKEKKETDSQRAAEKRVSKRKISVSLTVLKAWVHSYPWVPREMPFLLGLALEEFMLLTQEFCLMQHYEARFSNSRTKKIIYSYRIIIETE